MLEVEKHATQLRAMGFPDAPETLMHYMTEDELAEIEQALLACALSRPLARPADAERVGEIVRVAWRRMAQQHPGFE